MMRSLFLTALSLALVAAPALAAPAQPQPKAPAKAPAPKAVATPAPKVPGLTLAQALQTALTSQPQLRQAAADLAGARASAQQSRASLLPSVSVSSGYNLGPSRQNVNQAGIPLTNLGNYSVGVSADQMLYDFGQAGSRYEAANRQVTAQGESARATRQNVVLDVRTAYFTARANQNLVAVAEETLANQQRRLGQTRDLVEIGTRPPIDVAQTTSEVATARLQLINAQNALQTAKAQLNQAMGVERDTAYALADDAMPAIAGEDQALEALLKEAIANRPDIAAMAARLEAQALLVEAAEHANYPSLRASASAGTNGTPVTSPNNNWGLGVGFSWPLYSGGAREAQADQARASLDSLRAQADTLRQQLRLTLEQARLQVVAAKAAVQTSAEATRAARTRLTLAEGRYSAGVGSIIELQDAQLAYTNARSQEVQQSYTLALARARLVQALGRE